MIKLFASDLDGTLLNEMHETDSQIIEGIKTIQSHGKIVAAATGRSLMTSSHFDFPNIYYVADNGSMVLDGQGKILYEDLIDEEVLNEILERFADLPLEYVGRNWIYLTIDKDSPKKFKPKPRKGQSLEKFEKDQAVFEKFRKYNSSIEEIKKAGINKINIHKDVPVNLDELSAFVKANEDKLVNAGSYPGIFELNNKGTNKASGIRHLAKALNITEDEIAVYGDGGNDIAMLEAFEHSYAPSDGQPEAKAAAKEVIGPCKDHGVICHMLKTDKEESI